MQSDWKARDDKRIAEVKAIKEHKRRVEYTEKQIQRVNAAIARNSRS